MTRSYHHEIGMLDPFTGRVVGIDEGMVPVIERLWALGIETTGCCQDLKYDCAVVSFAEPKGFDESPDYWEPRRWNKAGWKRWEKAAEAWEASHTSGAQRTRELLSAGAHAAAADRWTWIFHNDGNPGSGLILPAPDIPVLAKALSELGRQP